MFAGSVGLMLLFCYGEYILYWLESMTDFTKDFPRETEVIMMKTIVQYRHASL